MGRLLTYLLKCMLLIVIVSSCKTVKMSNDQVRKYYDSLSYKDLYTIKKDDKISISIWNHDDLSIGSVYGVYNSNEVYGKWLLVDSRGNVPLPALGNVKLEGLNTIVAADTLTRLYESTIRNPIINVRVLNKEVSVLGELRKPGRVILEKENTSILEVIAKAEGLDFYADKKRISLIRIDSGKSKEYPLYFKSDYIPYLSDLYVKPGDVIYVHSKRGKTFDKKAPAILPIASLVTATVLMLKFLGY